MKTLTFNITINASPEKVWKTLWDDDTYRKWTSAFHEGSYALSSWKEGARVHFIGPSGDGMYSEIAKLTPNEHMAFRHLGTMKGGKEQPSSEESEKWEGAMETYTLLRDGHSTILHVSLDSADDFVDYFSTTFPKALELLKSIAES